MTERLAPTYWEEAPAKIEALLEKLPPEQRPQIEAVVKEFQNGMMPENQVFDITDRLISLQRQHQPRTMEDEILAIVVDYDRNSKIYWDY